MKAKDQYYEHILDILSKIKNTQNDAIEKAANMMSECIKNNKTIYAFGASHAGILTQELFYRAGGLALINPIMPKEVMLDVRPITQTSQMERLPGYGSLILKQTPINKGDVLIIHSVSGRNTIAIDMALKAKEKGVYLIALTNIKYSEALASRHESGKRLYEIAEIVIDNCGDFEDASTTIEGLNQKVAPTSTIAGAFIVNSLVIECVENLVKEGFEPPIFHSANVDGGDDFNKKIFKEYKDRIHYMN